jgi:hypothetical protein
MHGRTSQALGFFLPATCRIPSALPQCGDHAAADPGDHDSGQTAARDDVDAAYHAGLMAYRGDHPPPILPAALGENGPIAGAAGEAWSELLITLP